MRYFELGSIFLRSIYISYLKSFCTDFSLSLIHLFHHLFMSVELMDIYVILLSYYAKQFYLFYFSNCFSLVIGSSFTWVLCPLIDPPLVFICLIWFFSYLNTSSYFATYKTVQVHLAYLQLSSYNWLFLQGFWSLVPFIE